MPHAETHMVMKRKKPGGGIDGSFEAVPPAADAHHPSSLSSSSTSAVKLDPAPAVTTSAAMTIDLTLSDSDSSENRGSMASSDQQVSSSTPEQPAQPQVQQSAVSATPTGGRTGSCGTLSTQPQQLPKPEKPAVSVGHAKKILADTCTGALEAKGRATTPAHTSPPTEAGGARLPPIPTRNEEDANGSAVAQLSAASEEKRAAIERLNRRGVEVVMPAEAAAVNSFDPRDSLPSAEATAEVTLGKFSASAVVIAPTNTRNNNNQSRDLPYLTEANVNRSGNTDNSSGEINECIYNKKDNGDSSGEGRQTDNNLEAKTSENGQNGSDNNSNEDDVSVVSPTSSSSAESGSGNAEEEGDSDDVRGVSSSSSFASARDGMSDNDSSVKEKGARPLLRSLESEVEEAWGPKRKKQKHFHQIGRDAAGRSDREAEEMADSFSKSVGQAQSTVVDDIVEKNKRVGMKGGTEKAAPSPDTAAAQFRLPEETAATHRHEVGTDKECTLGKKDFVKHSTHPIVQRSLPSSATSTAVALPVAEAKGGSESSSFSDRMRKGEEWNRQLRQGILMADDSSDNDSDNARQQCNVGLNSMRRSTLAGDTQSNRLKDRLPLEEAPPSLLVPSEKKLVNSIEDKGRKTGLASPDSEQRDSPVPKATVHDSGLPSNNIYNKELPPLFPKATLDFLDAHGVKTVTDLTMTDTHQLARDLYDSTGFKLGCALTAWKFHKTLEEVAAFKLATSSVILWKRSLSQWLAENGASGGSIQQSRKQALQVSRPTVPVNESLDKILSYSDCSFLRKNFGIETAAQLLCADKGSIVKRLRRSMEQQMSNSEDRAQIKKEGFCSGIVYSWLVHVKEAVGLGLGDTFAPVSGERDAHELQSSASVTKTGINKHVQRATANLQVQEQKQFKPVQRTPPTTIHQMTPDQTLVSGGKPNQTFTRELPQQKTSPFQSDQPQPSHPKNHEEISQIRKMYQKLANRCQGQNGPVLQELLQHTKQLMRQLEAQIQQNGSQYAGHQIQDTPNRGDQQSGRKQRRSICKKVHNGGFSPLQQQTNQKKIAQLQDLSVTAGSPMKTPLPYGDIKFLRANGIHSDEHLLSVDLRALSDRYAAHKSALPVPFKGDAEVVVKRWVASAQGVILGKKTGDDVLPSPVPSSEHEEDLPLMDNVKKQCQTIIDEASGRPRRTITSFDCANNILYDFVIETRESSIPGAGFGAFLTYKGARVLKEGKRRPPTAATPALTRKILHASFSDGRNGVSVTLTGKKLHGDERFMGRSDGVGLWKQYCPDKDFEPTKDNVTFCSHDFGSGLIELGRYAPLLPTDRKTDLVFGVKNFIFSFEPSSWRFDVSEELYGHQQVVDFTSDTTGEPHEVAKSNIAMYVNEVGHNPDHLENVLSKEGDGRTVLYFLYIKKPIRVGQSFELLADYKIGYEEMRERKGYGRANIEHDMKCDKDDCMRLQRNIKERTDLERVIRSYTEADIESVLHFIRNRVLDGLISSTSVSVVSMKSENSSRSNSPTQSSFEITLRQWVARRRLHWISVIMMSQLKSLCSRTKSRYDLCSDTDLLISVDESDSGNSEASSGIRLKGSMYKEGMLVYVNGWESPNDPRPAYTGLATVESVSERENGGSLYTLGLERNRTIKDVPEGVLTHPQEEDVANSPKRIHSAWCRMKESESRPQRLRVMQETLKSMEWNSYINSVITGLWARRNPAAPVNKKARFLFEAIHLELSEEVLYNLSTQRHLLRPFDDTLWCPLSISLLRRLLRHLTFFSLSKDTVSAASQGRFLDALMRCASETAKRVRFFGQMNGKHLQGLALKRKQSKIVDNKQVSSMEDFIMGIPATVSSEYQKGSIVQGVPCPLEDLASARFVLHVEWYIIRQVICVAHAIASTVAWSYPNSTKMEQSQQVQVPIYSLKKLCSLLEIDHDIVRTYLSKMNPVVGEPTA